MTPIHYHFFQEKEAEETLSNLLDEASITLTPKPDKHITRKGNHKPVSLLNTDAYIINNTLAN